MSATRVRASRSPAFTAEAEDADAAEGVEERNRAEGKVLRGRKRPGKGQFQYQIHPSRERGPDPVGFGKQGGLPPLDKGAAHHGGDMGGSAAVLAACTVNLISVAAVKWIVFRDNTRYFHENNPPDIKKRRKTLENPTFLYYHSIRCL